MEVIILAVGIFVVVVTAVVFLMDAYSDYKMHYRNTTGYSAKWGLGTYNRFKVEFDKHTWGVSALGNLVTADGLNIAGPKVISFNGNGMVLKGYNFLRYNRFIKKRLAEEGIDHTLWSKDTTAAQDRPQELNAGDQALEEFRNIMKPNNKGGK